jgi:hypothetical protein
VNLKHSYSRNEQLYFFFTGSLFQGAGLAGALNPKTLGAVVRDPCSLPKTAGNVEASKQLSNMAEAFLSGNFQQGFGEIVNVRETCFSVQTILETTHTNVWCCVSSQIIAYNGNEHFVHLNVF